MEYIFDVQAPLSDEVAGIVKVVPRAESTLEETTPLRVARLHLSFWEHLKEHPVLCASELMSGVDALVHESHRHRPVERAKISEKGDERLMFSCLSSRGQLRKEACLEEFAGDVAPPCARQRRVSGF